MYGNWAADQQDAYNKTDWTYCYNPDTYDSKCSARGIAAPPPRLSFDLQPMPPSLTTLVPQDTTSAPAPPPTPSCGFADMGPTFAQWRSDNGITGDVIPDAAQQELFTNYAIQRCPQWEDFLRNGISISGDIQLGSDSTGQTMATAKFNQIAISNAAQAQTNVAPTASAPPAPTSPPVPPGALPSTGIIVGAAVGLAALLLLV